MHCAEQSDCELPSYVEDINTAEETHGKDALHIKGQTMRQKPTATAIVKIFAPRELKDMHQKMSHAWMQCAQTN